MQKIIHVSLILAYVKVCWAIEFRLGTGWNPSEKTLGEISLGDYNNQASAITLEYKGAPFVKEIPIKIPHIVPQTVVQPYPVLVPVTKPVPYEVEKYVIKHVEKKVPVKVEKIIPVPVEKLIPFEVERYQGVPVIKKVPLRIPVHKTIVHYSKN